MKNIFKKLIIGAAIIYAPLQSMAWGTEGHRIAGQIADSYLTAKARAAIKAILGNESIAIASNWADFIKSDPNYNYLSAWHYVDLDKEYTLPELQDFLKQDTKEDAYTKLNFLIAELKKKDLSKENKLLYLRMLVHIVEDVHQRIGGRNIDHFSIGKHGLESSLQYPPVILRVDILDEQETAGSGMTANDLWDIQERDIFEATHQGKGSTAEDF